MNFLLSCFFKLHDSAELLCTASHKYTTPLHELEWSGVWMASCRAVPCGDHGITSSSFRKSFVVPALEESLLTQKTEPLFPPVASWRLLVWEREGATSQPFPRLTKPVSHILLKDWQNNERRAWKCRLDERAERLFGFALQALLEALHTCTLLRHKLSPVRHLS